MFTGIVEELGVLKKISKRGKLTSFQIKASKVLEGTLIGDSIAVNGVCLTLTEMSQGLSGTDSYFCADLMLESQKCTNMNLLKVSSILHLERALTLEKPLGGHLVSGHVDFATPILRIKSLKDQTELTFKLPSSHKAFFHLKGSVALNGVSLTLSSVLESSFSVSIIPHTLKETHIKNWKVGDLINVECDQLLKSFHSHTQYQNQNINNKSSLTLNKLKIMGY